MGLIDRIPQHRLLDGSLYIAEIAITDKFAELFGIRENNRKEEDTDRNSEQQPARKIQSVINIAHRGVELNPRCCISVARLYKLS